MISLPFSAIGTEWCVLIDQAISKQQQTEISEQVHAETTRFDERFSRFLSTSWLSTVNTESEEEERRYSLDEEGVELFSLGKELEKLTQGHFTLNIGSELEALGYDAHYTLEPRALPKTPKGRYWLEGATLVIQGKVSLDLGSYGKGYLIDRLAKLLQQQEIKHYLVDGSGDLYGTSKASGQPWEIALEHPFDPKQSIGRTTLYFQGLASSSTLRRQWGTAHHILNGQTGRPVTSPAAVFIQAESAMLADALSTAYFVSPQKYWPILRERWNHTWCILDGTPQSLKAAQAPKFPGTLF